MNSRTLGADYVFAWPQVELGVMGAEQAVGILNRREIAAARDPLAHRRLLAGAYSAEHLHVERAGAEGFIDEAISVTGELSALTPVDASAGLVDFRWAVHNQVDATVCRATVQVLWRRDEERAERIVERPPFWHDAVTGTDDGGFVPLPL